MLLSQAFVLPCTDYCAICVFSWTRPFARGTLENFLIIMSTISLKIFWLNARDFSLYRV